MTYNMPIIHSCEQRRQTNPLLQQIHTYFLRAIPHKRAHTTRLTYGWFGVFAQQQGISMCKSMQRPKQCTFLMCNMMNNGIKYYIIQLWHKSKTTLSGLAGQTTLIGPLLGHNSCACSTRPTLFVVFHKHHRAVACHGLSTNNKTIKET